MNRRGFTLVEIMIVVAIIALLAAIAIPNLLRARLTASQATAQATLRTLSTAQESYAAGHNGNYSKNYAGDLFGADPKYINENYCDGTKRNMYTYACQETVTTDYLITANPDSTTGGIIYVIRTGGVLSQQNQ